MKHQDLIKEMQDCVGVQDPIVYFQKLTDLFGLLFDRVDQLEKQLHQVKVHAALAIQWDPKVAANMLAEQIKKLRAADKDAYAVEIISLQAAYSLNIITQEYADFCKFWQEVLGYHPFLDYQ